MRIRRHAKISQLVLDTAPSLKPGSALLQIYHCQLNQSPWDVITFSPPSSPPPPPSFQVNGADASGGNGGSDHRISVGEREIQTNGNMDERAVGDAVAAAEKKKKKKVKKETVEMKKEQCCKTDGKSWRCRREAADGSSLCDHHLSLVKNYQNLAHNSTAKKPAAKSSPVETTRHSTRSSNKASSPLHSREFYYYSGFRPGWSKKRSGQTSKNDDPGGPSKVDEKHGRVRLGGCSQIGKYEHEIDSEEDDEYEEGGEGKGSGKEKKRVRKPIKARSLKSLM